MIKQKNMQNKSSYDNINYYYLQNLYLFQRKKHPFTFLLLLKLCSFRLIKN